jgi:hypothetical protein
MWVIFSVPLFKSIMEKERIYGYFMEDGAAAHTANYFNNVLNKVFLPSRQTDKSHRVIFTRSSDLKLYDLYL